MSAAPAPAPPGALAAAWAVMRKDLQIELRTREIVATAGVFAVVVGFLGSVAFYVNDKTNPAVAAGTIWITLFFAAVLSFGRVWQRERDESALTGLLVSPIPRASIFVGKAVATVLMILAIATPLVALCIFLFQIELKEAALPVVALLVMGTAALSFVGTLFGAMTVRTRARDLILAIVLFPLLSPVLLCGVVGTRKAFEHQPLDAYDGFVGLMAVSLVVSLAIGIGLFGALVDE